MFAEAQGHAIAYANIKSVGLYALQLENDEGWARRRGALLSCGSFLPVLVDAPAIGSLIPASGARLQEGVKQDGCRTWLARVFTAVEGELLILAEASKRRWDELRDDASSRNAFCPARRSMGHVTVAQSLCL